VRSQGELVRSFRELHARDGALVIPNPWDAGSARVLAGMGFEALATTSSGHAFTLGRRDGGATRDDALDHLRALVASVDVPINADLGNCFGDDPATVAETMQLAAATGIAGASVEDATGDPARPIYEFELAVERVRAAAEAVRAMPTPVLLTARAENFLHGRRDLDDTIARLRAFQDAGADVLYAPGITTRDDIAAVVAAVERPVNVLAGMPGMDLTVGDLAELGVKRVSTGGLLARAAIGALLRASAELRDRGSFGFAAEAASFRDVTEWLD
jgi:2-methylisocitrate lyase-like PEP mutase family enzyme